MKTCGFDDLLEETMDELNLEEFEKLEEQVLMQEPYVFFEDFEAKMETLMETQEKQIDISDRKKRYNRQHREVLARVALVAVMVGVGVFSSKKENKIYAGMRSMIYRAYSDNVEIQGVDSEDVQEIMESEDAVEWKEPTYVPEGYVKDWVDKNEDVRSYTITYRNENENALDYTQCTGNVVIGLTSDGHMEPLKIGNIDAKMTRDQRGIVTIFWEESGWIYYVMGESEDLSLEELIKVVESIR